MADKIKISRVIRNRTLKCLAQAVILFGIFWGISFLQENDAGVEAFHRAALFSILAVAGYTINRVFNLAEKTRLGERLYNAGTALGMIVFGLGLWLMLAAFNEFRVWPGKTALIIFCGIIGVAVSRLAAYRGRKEGGLWWGLLGWLEDRPELKFLIGVVIGLYLVYLRPYLTIDPNSLMLIEWFFFCILGFTILLRVWMGMGHGYSEEEVGLNWSKHRPQVEKLTGTGHDYMVRVERQFVNTGEPVNLYVLLTVLLDDNRIDEEEIVQAVRPMVDFNGINEVRQSMLRMSRHAARQQVELRKVAMKSAFDNIKSIVSLNKTIVSRRNSTIINYERTSFQEEIPIDELKRLFLEDGDRVGLFVRLTLMLHRAGRHQEHIVSALRSLTDDNGRPSTLALKTLLNNLDRTVGVND